MTKLMFNQQTHIQTRHFSKAVTFDKNDLVYCTMILKLNVRPRNKIKQECSWNLIFTGISQYTKKMDQPLKITDKTTAEGL